MKVIIDENIREDKYILQLGDLVESAYGGSQLYVVTNQLDSSSGKYKYILWSLEGGMGYNGYFDDLKNLTYSLIENERVFKASEYELKLVRKGE